MKAFSTKNVFLSLTTLFFPSFAGSFFGRETSSRRDDTIVTLDKRSAVGGNTNRQQHNKTNNKMKIKSLIKHNLMRAAMTLALIMTCATAWAETVETYYIDENGTRHDVTATVVTTYMDNLGTDDETTWYVVNENVFLYDGSNNQTCLHGNVNLIIADGCELKPASGSSGSSDGFRGSGNLTLYGQTAGTGTLSCDQEGFMNITGDFTVCSGMVSVSGNRCNAIRAANFTMRGGSVSITNNTNNDCGIEATGTVNIYSGSVVAAGSIGIAAGTVNIYGGSVTARSNGGNAEESNYGRAIQCSSTFNFYGGNVTAQSDLNLLEDQTRYGIYANGINLSWTSTADWINSINDGNLDNVICYFFGSGGLTIAPYKPFTDGNNTYTGTFSGEQVETFAGVTLLQPNVPAFADSGDGTPEHPYTIYNATGWGQFCDALQDATYNHFSGKTVKLGANISVTQSAGSNDHRFMGTFDGQEHTLDVDITDTGEQGTAPFRFISNATIRNLHVTGTVTGTTHAAGLVGKAIAGTILIENCLVETNVNSTVGNNRHCGGIVGHGFGGNNPVDLTLRNCVYAGTITCDKNYIGGLQGWSDGNTLTLENCLFAGNYQGTATGTAAFHPIALHNTGATTNLTATNVFAAVAPTATNANFIAADGTKTTGRTTAPAGLGTQGATYSFMDMTVYENGLYYNGLYYVAPTLSTDNSGAYLINNEDDWDYFCDALYNNATWNRFSGQTVKLGADISVSRMAGYDNHDFLGTFDGNHDTLTFTATATASYLAPFRNVLGNSTTDRAVIRDLNVVTNITAHDQRHMAGLIALVWGYVDVTNCNVTVDITATKGSTNTDLYPAGIASQVVKDAQIAVSGCTVDGTISTDGKYAGGIIGIAQGSASITDCLSSVTINSSTDGDGTHGGFVGVQGNYDGKTITIEGCVFNGSLLGASTHSCGGFLGWRSQTVTISNSLFAPVQVTINTTDGSTPCATFVRNGDSNTTITDCYYTTALGTAQGTQVYSISKGEYVTTLEINSTANPSYTVSGLSFYSTGIKCGDVLFAEANDVVSLILAHQDREGYDFIGYTATAGNLNGSSLTMPDGNVTINAEYTCTAPSGLTATDITFTTATLSWSGVQDSYNVRYRPAGGEGFNFFEGFEDCDWTLPVGWTGGGEWYACYNCNSFEAHSGGYFAGGYNSGTWLITPMMDLSGQNNVTLKFWYINVDHLGSDPAQLEVYYRIVEDDEPTDWEWLWSNQGEHEVWTEATISLTENLSANYQIGFYLSQGQPVLLDDISVISTGTGANEWQTINSIAATTTTLTGLTPDMPYQWQVRGLNCDGNNGATEWSAMGTFTTLLHDPVAYIDENGDTQQCTDYTPLTGTETTLTAGWYVADGTLNYDHTLILSGDVHLLLKDGAVMNVGTEQQPISGEYGIGENGSLHIYGQSAGSGYLYIYCEEYGISVDDDYEQNGGNVTISAGIHGIFTGGDVTLRDGTLSTIGDSYYGISGGGNVNILGGKCTAKSKQRLTGINANSDGSIILGWKNTDDYIDASGYALSNSNAVVQIADGQLFIDEDGNTYSGIIERDGTTYTYPIDGKKLLPYIEGSVPYLDMNGRRQLCTEFTTLDGSESTLTAGWYVADGTLDYDHTITLSGDIHLILKDNAVMNVTSTEGYGFYYYSSSIPPSISIYAQSTGESKGQLHVDASVHGLYTRNDITINGGWVEATSNQSYGIFASSGNVIINGGIVEATGGVYGIFGGNSVEIHGGEVTAIGPSYGINAQPGSVVISGGKVTATATNGTGIHARYSITISGGQVTANGRYDGIYTYDGIILGWTNASDFIYASSFYINNSNNYITLSKAFKDVDGQTYSGTVAKVSGAYAIDGKTLYPDCVVMKQVEGYEEGNGGWVFIASPVAGSIAPSEVHNLIATTEEDFDLYRFNQSDANGNEWQNWKATTTENHPDFTSLVNGQGYLYATKETRTLVFAGEYTAATGPVEVPLAYDENAEFAGWNLVGNPFADTAYVDHDFYVMNDSGSEIIAAERDYVHPMEGIFVKAEGEHDDTMTFSLQAPCKGQSSKPKHEQIVINLSRDRGPSTGSGTTIIDRAIVRMGEGHTQPKFQLNRNSTKLYIPQGQEEYAIVSVGRDGARHVSTMPINFKAETDGTYTITVNVDNVEMAYLHLIDNLTGADVDLLAANGGDTINRVSTYTFTAKTTDHESRFKLVFSTNDADDTSTPSTGSETEGSGPDDVRTQKIVIE